MSWAVVITRDDAEAPDPGLSSEPHFPTENHP